MADEFVASLLLDSANRALREGCDAPMWQHVDAGVWPGALWELLDELGLPLALVSEASGGAGLTFQQAGRILGLAASHALPLPLAETMLAGWVLDQAAIAVPAGPLALVTTFPTSGFKWSAAGSGGDISGTADRVPWGRDCRAIVVTDPEGGNVALVSLDGPEIAKGTNLAYEPRDSIVLDEAEILAVGDAGLNSANLRGVGAVIRAVQIAGACGACLETVTEYVNTRKQFGRPIGKFQAVQHLVAQIATETAAAGAAADLGLDAVEQDIDLFGVACAKIRAADAAGEVSALAHQALAAIGFTHEHSLHRSTSRLWAWREEFGTASWWATQLGRAVSSDGGSRLWHRIAA